MKFLQKEAKTAVDRLLLEDNFHREVEMLKAVDHPNIVNMLDHFDAGSHYCIVSELAEGKSLS